MNDIKPLPGTTGVRYLPTGWESWSWDSFGIGIFIGLDIGILLGVLIYV